jgi:hypothetical protein
MNKPKHTFFLNETFGYPCVYQSNYISPFTPNYYYFYPIAISPMHQINYLENKINTLFSLSNLHFIITKNESLLPTLKSFLLFITTANMYTYLYFQTQTSLSKYITFKLNEKNGINNLLYTKVSAVFDRKYKERKLRYENLLLKEKLLKYGKVNNDCVNVKETIYNKHIMKIINDKLKPIEDKQTKFMEIINKLLIHNEKDKDVINKKVLKKQNVWKNIIKGNDNLFKGIDFILKEEITNPQNLKPDNDNENDKNMNQNRMIMIIRVIQLMIFDYTKYHLDDNSNETNNNNN